MKVHFVFASPLVKTKTAPVWEAALPPLGILYLAAYLHRLRPDVELKATDGLLQGMNKTLAEIRSFQPDVLCVSFYTGSALGAYRLINWARQEYSEMVTIAGGPHATALPEDVLTHSATDVVVRGEGERTLATLITLLLDKGKLTADVLASVDGIAFRDRNGLVRVTRSPKSLLDLDEIPFPAWHLLPLSDYRGYHLRKQTPEYPILFSRGCPYDCVFCPNEHWNLSKPKVRFRTPKNIVDEMEGLAHTYSIREFNNLADELNNHPRIALEICEEIKRRRLGVTWKTMLRADKVPERLVRAMAESGCWMASVGIETGNPETMVGIRKGFTHEQVENACRLFKKYGLKVQGYFMLFNAWEENGELCFEDAEASRNTIRYAQRLFSEKLLDYMGWSVTTPYPGSELYWIAVRHGLIKPELAGKWDDWNQNTLFVMKLPGVDELEQARVLRSAQTLGVRASLVRRGVRLVDIPMMGRTALQTLRTELGAALHRNIPSSSG